MHDPPPRLYLGSRVAHAPGDAVLPRGGFAWCSPSLDAAIWAAELAEGDAAPRVYAVAATGPIEDVTGQQGYAPPPYPAMSWRSPAPLTVLEEVTDLPCYHGTRAELRPGDLVEPGHAANFGATPRAANFVYFTQTLDAATWGAELAAGDGPGRIYRVEPTGPVEPDPNLTNRRFRGNPTRSFRSRAPLRVLDELQRWTGHAPEAVRAMKEGLARLTQQGVEPEDA